MCSRASWLAAATLGAVAGLQCAHAQTATARLAAALAIDTVLEALVSVESADTGPEALVSAESADTGPPAEPADGAPRVRLTPLDNPVPGAEVVYTVAFTNVGDRPLQDARISAAIPPGLRYVEGTAVAPGARILFSVDGGMRYAPPEELVVSDPLGDERAAQAADYTHVRWVLRAPLEPGARGTARFRALVLDTV